MFVDEVVNVNDKLVRNLAKSKQRLRSLSGSRGRAHQTYDLSRRLNESLQIVEHQGHGTEIKQGR